MRNNLVAAAMMILLAIGWVIFSLWLSSAPELIEDGDGEEGLAIPNLHGSHFSLKR